MIKYAMNGTVYTFYTKTNRRQRRIIIKPIGEHAFQVSMPSYTNKKTLIRVIEENQTTLLKLKHQKPVIESILEEEALLIFGEGYKLIFGEKTEIDQTNKILYVKSIKTDIAHKTRALKQTLKSILLQHVHTLEALYEQDFPLEEVQYRFQYMKSKFGSCQPHLKRISFNLELIHYPKIYLEYIFVHEICHLIHANHSKAYYDLLSKYMPNHRTLKQSLNTLRKALFLNHTRPMIDKDSPL